MRRHTLRLPLVASALVALVGSLAIAAGSAAQPPRGSERPAPRASLADIEDEVMCPVCGVPLELALEAPQADAQRDFIRRLIAEGRTEAQIKDALVAEYGEEVLAVPGDEGFDLAAWVVPAAAFAVALGSIVLALRRWRRARPATESPPPPGSGSEPDREDSERLDADLARYDL